MHISNLAPRGGVLADIVETTFFGNLKDDGSGCDAYPFVSNKIYTGYSGTPTVFRYVGK